jgi:hypothetical protein
VHALVEKELVPLWEDGEAAGPLRRAALLLDAGAPELDPDALDELTVGQRDAELLALHVRTFGDHLEGFVRCPRCDEPLEVELREAELEAVTAACPELGEHELELGHYRVRFRPVTCGDLAAASAAADAPGARATLLERCVLEARRDGEAVEPGALPEEAVVALGDRLVACDPQAEIALGVTCPECGHGWRAIVDVGAFLWSEVSRSARRILEEVHVLASTYGWTEQDVLGLSARRRRLYLELALG